MKIDVAVIPAAGMGTRMRPATRVVPKALITVVDRPAIQYVVEEAARGGATSVILVVDPGVGELTERHFYELGPLPGLEDVQVRAVIQKEPLGLGHAVWSARNAVGERPFFCLLADNIVPPGRDVLPALAAASDGRSVMCVRELGPEFLHRYGVVVPGAWRSDTVLEITGAIEKPGVERAPSNLGLIGRYVFTPEVFDLLEGQEAGHGGEIQLTDAIETLASTNRALASVAPGDLLDVGTPPGLLHATAVLGAAHEEYGPDFKVIMKALTEEG